MKSSNLMVVLNFRYSKFNRKYIKTKKFGVNIFQLFHTSSHFVSDCVFLQTRPHSIIFLNPKAFLFFFVILSFYFSSAFNRSIKSIIITRLGLKQRE